MRTRAWFAVASATLMVVGCHGHDHDHGHGHGHGHGAKADHAHDKGHGHKAKHGHGDDHGHGEGTAYTTYAERTELFVEIPNLVVNEPVSLAAHVTHLSNFGPATEGKVMVILSGGAHPAEQFEIEGVDVPGIFRPVVKPQHTGERTMRVQVITGDIDEVHLVGTFQVAIDQAEADKLAEKTEETGESDGEGEIGFTKEQQWRIDFATTPVVQRSIRPSFEAYGTLKARPDGEALVAAPVAGHLAARAAGTLPKIGDKVTAGQTVAALLPQLSDAGDGAALEQTAEEARLSVDRASREVKRLEPLLAAGAIAEKKLLDARYQMAQAQARYTAATRRISQARGGLGKGGGLPDGAVTVVSPIAGTVVAVSGVPGGFVEVGTTLCHVVDLERLWLEVHVTETHARYLEKPQGVWFGVPGFDDIYELGAERVVTVGGVLDTRTRTVPLFVEVDNPKGRLRVGMFADVHVLTDAPHLGLAVPNSAVVHESGLPVVYVSLGGETFTRRPVKLGPRDGGFIELLDGVKVGERVVSVGAYAVRLAGAGTAVPDHGHAH